MEAECQEFVSLYSALHVIVHQVGGQIQNYLRRVLKIAFVGFLYFSRADFTSFLKEHSGLCD